MNSTAVHLQRFLGDPHSGNGEAHSDLTVVTGRLRACLLATSLSRTLSRYAVVRPRLPR